MSVFNKRGGVDLIKPVHRIGNNDVSNSFVIFVDLLLYSRNKLLKFSYNEVMELIISENLLEYHKIVQNLSSFYSRDSVYTYKNITLYTP